MHRSNYSRVEAGERELSIDAINKIAQFFHMTIDQLVNFEGELPKEVTIEDKLIKQNLQIKTFLGTSENACKSQIFIAIIAYLLLELVRRTICKTSYRFGHFATLIRVCLTQYKGLSYINNTKIEVRRARKRQNSPPDLFGTTSDEKKRATFPGIVSNK